MAVIDLTGQKFGFYTVLRRAPSQLRKSYWLARCECGTEREVRSCQLRQGKATNCGCKRSRPAGPHSKVDLTGHRFGRWEVINEAQRSRSQTKWLCRCDCGTQRAVPAQRLRAGKSKSCGCARTDITKFSAKGRRVIAANRLARARLAPKPKPVAERGPLATDEQSAIEAWMAENEVTRIENGEWDAWRAKAGVCRRRWAWS